MSTPPARLIDDGLVSREGAAPDEPGEAEGAVLPPAAGLLAVATRDPVGSPERPAAAAAGREEGAA